MVAHGCMRGRATHYRVFGEIRLEPSTAFARFSTLPSRFAEQNQSNQTSTCCQAFGASPVAAVHCGIDLHPSRGVDRTDGSRPMGASQGAMAGITGEDLSVGKEPYPGYFQGKPYQIQADDVDFWEPAAAHHPASFFSRFEGPRSCHVTAKQEERSHVELCGIGVRLTHDEDGHAVLIQRVVSKHLCAARRSCLSALIRALTFVGSH